MNNSILQDWILELPLKMQTVLCLSTRGPDNLKSSYIKTFTRILRAYVYKPADPDNPDFMTADIPLPIIRKTSEIKDLEFVTLHYFTHMLHGIEIIGYAYPDPTIAKRFEELYYSLVAMLHLHSESKIELFHRLGTKTWKTGQPANFSEVIKKG